LRSTLCCLGFVFLSGSFCASIIFSIPLHWTWNVGFFFYPLFQANSFEWAATTPERTAQIVHTDRQLVFFASLIVLEHLLGVCVDRLHIVLVNTGVISCWLMYVKPSYLPMTVADFESLCVLTGLNYVQNPGQKSGQSLYLNVPGVVYSCIVSTTYVMAVIVAMW
jgi:hypothetical protein